MDDLLWHCFGQPDATILTTALMKFLLNSFFSSRIVVVLCFFVCSTTLSAQSKKVLIDIAHGQRFWHDPANMPGKDPQFVERVKYMTAEITTSAKAGDASIGYVTGKIDDGVLAKCDLLFIHLPSAKYEVTEVDAVKKYLENGGSLFLVMDVDYWSTLEQTNVNDMVTPYGISFGVNSADTLWGGHTQVGLITKTTLKIPYHGARRLEGGTVFANNDQTDEAFATFVELRKGGKIIAMGDGMVSLYMTAWKDVTDYKCQDFMTAAFQWLLK
jgi:hypothetical protein